MIRHQLYGALLIAVAPIIACGPPPSSAGAGAAPRQALVGGIGRDDRVTVGRGTIVRAVGVSRRWVYAATLDAIFVYDRDRRAWLPPFGRDAGFDPSLVRRIGIDPDDESAWLITTMGAWTLQPLTGFLMRAPAGPVPARLIVSSLETVYREFPSVQSFERLFTRDDASLWSYPAISGARAPDRAEVWLGTNGGGLVRVDPLFNRATPLAYGLATAGVSAMARAADGLWIAPASRGVEARPAITFVSLDLQQFRWLDDATGRSFDARATALAVRNGALWIGTTSGLVRIAPTMTGGRTVISRWDESGDVVLALLNHPDGLWVGTDRGLALMVLDSTDTPAAVIHDVHGPRVPVRALAASDSLMFVALADAVYTRAVYDSAWREPWPMVAWRSVGDITALAADARTVWAGGAFGVLVVDRATGGSRILRVGSDLPDAVTSLLLDPSYVWIGTLRGLVRIRRTSDGFFL